MKDITLKYGKSAEFSDLGWERQALPIGDGKMGMVIYGGVKTERLQFNEKTFWKGGPSPRRPDYMGGNLCDRAEDLQKMRDALSRGDKQAVSTYGERLIGIKDGYGTYLNFGEVVLNFAHGETCSSYERGLRLTDGAAYVRYEADGVKYSREFIACYPKNVIAMRLSADKKDALNLSVSLSITKDNLTSEAADGAIYACGYLDDNGLKYAVKLTAKTDGTLFSENGKIVVENATNAELFLTCGTDYADVYPKYRGEAPNESVIARAAVARELGYDALYALHTADYKAFYDRAEVDLKSENTALYTDELLERYKRGRATDGEKRLLEETLFAYGRYLIIASSRDGSLPANLQGGWNGSDEPAWSCDYHLNVNLQMCYWHVYSTNLAELAKPMLRYMYGLRAPGRVTAEKYYGIASTKENPENGWVANTQNTPFGWTCPGWEFSWGWSPASSTWMMQNCYEYFAYTGDIEELKSNIYPMMRENAQFWLQNLRYDEAQDRYVSSPTASPEHGEITVGNTYEQELIWQLFADTVAAGERVGESAEFLSRLKAVRDKLKPLSVGKWGQIKEWYEEDEWYRPLVPRYFIYKKHNCQYKHRHASHLVGLYPGSHITRETPEFFAAARVSLLDRGFGRRKGMNGAGWSKANKTCLWARLKDGERAYRMLEDLLKKNIAANLWDLHPPFQMDGNCGYTAAVAEMLIYSGDGYVELLPALPAAWRKEGNAKGLCAKCGFSFDFAWNNGKITEVTAHSAFAKNANVYINGKMTLLSPDKKYTF